MNEFEKAYRSKLISAEAFVGEIKPGSILTFGTWSGQPMGVMTALEKHGQDISPLYVVISFTTGAGEFYNRPGVYCLTGFYGPYERQAQADHQNVFYTPIQYTDAIAMIHDSYQSDCIIFRVAPMDEKGYFNCSLTGSWEFETLRWIHRNSPETRIVFEVNPNLPRARGVPELGDNKLHISMANAIVEDDSPMTEFATPAPTETEKAIAANVARLIEDRATIQLGFGTIPMVIGELLTERKELGIHTEMFCEAHMDLIESGSVTNAHKGLHNGMSVATFGAGGPRLWKWAEDNPEFAILPVESVNRIDVLAKVNKMTSINSVLMLDLNGQACAHCIGPNTYSGLGGALEFAYGAQLSPGGKSILCLPSIKKLKDGSEVSNIVAQFPAGTRVTVPEHCVDWVVTDFGAARLKFLNQEQRAAALIELAHPKFRDELAKQAREQGLRLSRVDELPAPPASFFSKPD